MLSVGVERARLCKGPREGQLKMDFDLIGIAMYASPLLLIWVLYVRRRARRHFGAEFVSE